MAEGAPRPGGWRAFTASFGYAWDGIVETALRQRNMRIHLLAAVAVAALGQAVPLGVAEQLGLVFCVFLVPAAEVANTALESLVDLVTSDRDERARVAKDAGAGVVLVLAACSVAVLGVVLVRAAPTLVAARSALGLQLAFALGIGTAMVGLLAGGAAARGVDVLLAAGGLALLVAAALRSCSAVFTAIGGLAFAVAVGAALVRRRGSVPSP